MKHEAIDTDQSVMIYTYTIETARKRFACMRDFLLVHRAE